MKLIKVFDKGLISPFRNMQFKLGETYTCKNFSTDIRLDCAPGFYATDWDGLSYAYRQGKEVYQVEVSGKSVEYNQFKRRYERIKILKQIPLKEIKSCLKMASKDAGYDLYHASFPTKPLMGKAKIPAVKHVLLLKEWASVWASVRASVLASVRDSVLASVWASVLDSVWASVWDSVWASVRDSVLDSVWASVLAYISSLFPHIKQWKYVKHEEGKNPYQACVDLWKAGFAPSFNGETWRLHSGKNAEIVYVDKQ